MQVLGPVWSTLLSWLTLPLALWSSIVTGGWGRLAKAPCEGLLTKELPAYSMAGDALGTIHFVNSGPSDVILLESDGHFALVDAGYGPQAAEYVKQVAGGHLEFAVGTHAHGDHIAGFGDALLEDPDITVDRVYLKPYRGENKYSFEKSWTNQERYDRMVAQCQARGIELVQEGLDGRKLTLGNMELTIYNGALEPNSRDENANSLGLLVECGGMRAFLAGDLNNLGFRETRIAREIGPVDLLKAGHHGFDGSTTIGCLAFLRPAMTVFTNRSKSGAASLFDRIQDEVALTVQCRVAWVANSQMLATGDFAGGVAAVFGAQGLQYYEIEE
ncbi:MAG: MBL fold metallo-hydrolase [Oscillospiraceae bacterium]|nr:MBL fold metallo-hydrolase [Oscillospiraceae bacterium]